MVSRPVLGPTQLHVVRVLEAFCPDVEWQGSKDGNLLPSYAEVKMLLLFLHSPTPRLYGVVFDEAQGQNYRNLRYIKMNKVLFFFISANS
jgi:hypothetical protein